MIRYGTLLFQSKVVTSTASNNHNNFTNIIRNKLEDENENQGLLGQRRNSTAKCTRNNTTIRSHHDAPYVQHTDPMMEPTSLILYDMIRNDKRILSSTTSKQSNNGFDLELLAWYLPPILSVMAFLSYDVTRQLFHTIITMDQYPILLPPIVSSSDISTITTSTSSSMSSSSITTSMISDFVFPILNGPVTVSISILFGTLIAMTIQSLYQRQMIIHKMIINMLEEIRLLHLYLHYTTDHHNDTTRMYQQSLKELLHSYTHQTLDDILCNGESDDDQTISPDILRFHNQELSRFIVVFNEYCNDPNCTPPKHIDAIYQSLSQMKLSRSELSSVLVSVFTTPHYINISILAITLLFVFLFETDIISSPTAMTTTSSVVSASTEIHFQLSICWSLLLGTYTMLAVIIYDLATPYTGVFAVANAITKRDTEYLRSYTFANDVIPSTNNIL